MWVGVQGWIRLSFKSGGGAPAFTNSPWFGEDGSGEYDDDEEEEEEEEQEEPMYQ